MHAGSSLKTGLDSALDVEMILFVRGVCQDGSIYVDCNGVRVEGAIFPVDMAGLTDPA